MTCCTIAIHLLLSRLLLGRLPLLSTRLSYPRALIAFALAKIQAPVSPFARFSDWARVIDEHFIQRKVVTDRVLRKSTITVNEPYHRY
jgi:hypothetical protein